MRREHNIQQSYIDWLKSLGCVFYAPLTQNDTNDNISGQPMTLGNNGTVTWQTSENAWYFQDLYSSSYDVVASWQGLSLPFDITNIGFTLVYTIKVVQDGYNPYDSNMGKIAPLVLGGRTAIFNCNYIVNSLNTWIDGAIVLPKYEGVSRYNYWYRNGVQVYSVNRGTTKFTGNSLTNTRIDSNYRNSTTYSNCKYCLKNAMVFHTALTQAQIREIQGY